MRFSLFFIGLFNPNSSFIISNVKKKSRISKYRKKKKLTPFGRFVFKSYKKLKAFAQEFSVIYGVEQTVISYYTYPVNIRNLNSQDNKHEEKARLGGIVKSALQYQLASDVIRDKDNKKFQKYFWEEIVDYSKHEEILQNFWELKSNCLVKQYTKINRHLDVNQLENQFNQVALRVLQEIKFSMQQSEIRGHFTVPGHCNNACYAALGDPNFNNSLALLSSPAFNQSHYSSSSVFQHRITRLGYEGSGKNKILLGAFNEFRLFTIRAFKKPIVIDGALRFTAAFSPRWKTTIGECLTMNSMFFLRFPDLFGIFPSTGYIYAKIYIGLGLMVEDFSLVPSVGMLFQTGVRNIGFLQIMVYSNISGFSIGLRKSKHLFRGRQRSDEFRDSWDYVCGKEFTTINKFEICLGKEKPKQSALVQYLTQ